MIDLIVVFHFTCVSQASSCIHKEFWGSTALHLLSTFLLLGISGGEQDQLIIRIKLMSIKV